MPQSFGGGFAPRASVAAYGMSVNGRRDSGVPRVQSCRLRKVSTCAQGRAAHDIGTRSPLQGRCRARCAGRSRAARLGCDPALSGSASPPWPATARRQIRKSGLEKRDERDRLIRPRSRRRSARRGRSPDEPRSNGQTEGQINPLKTLKRQMYGRANIDLLRVRLVAAP